MGEFAQHDGERVKIGTCESLYYLRWQDRHAVEPLPGNVHPGKDTGLSYRLPVPSEDMEPPGGYSSSWVYVDLPGFKFDGPENAIYPGPFRLYALKHCRNDEGREIVVPCVTDGNESWSLPDVGAWGGVIACVQCPFLKGRLQLVERAHGPREEVAVTNLPQFNGSPYPF